RPAAALACIKLSLTFLFYYLPSSFQYWTKKSTIFLIFVHFLNILITLIAYESFNIHQIRIMFQFFIRFFSADAAFMCVFFTYIRRSSIGCLEFLRWSFSAPCAWLI